MSLATPGNQGAEMPQETEVGTPATPRTPAERRGLRRPLTPPPLLGQATPFQRLREYLYYLELKTAADNLGSELDRAEKEGLSPSEMLERLLAAEVETTKARRLQTRVQMAQLPRGKTLENFDFDFQPSLDRRVIAELSTLRFIEERRNVILVGPPGVGKTHLAAALGLAAVDVGYRVCFTQAADLVQSLQRHHDRGSLRTREHGYITGPPLLIIDELGYLPMDQAAGNWIFHVVSKRYERGSIILTSNRGFADWGQIFNDAVVATAIVDRLIHDATVVNIRGKSYRMRSHFADQLDDRMVGYAIPTKARGGDA